MSDNKKKQSIGVKKRLTVLLKAVVGSVMYYTTPLLPIVALAVGGWAFLHEGLKAALPAFVGFFCSIVTLSSLPELNRHRKKFWSEYRLLDAEKR